MAYQSTTFPVDAPPDVAGGPGPAALASDALPLLDHLGIAPAALIAAGHSTSIERPDVFNPEARVSQGASAMKWCRFQSGRSVAYGVIEGTTVTEVAGSPFDAHTRTSTTVPLSRVKLLVPVIPPTFYAAGVNYREHVTQMAHRRGVKPEFPPHADVGYRANNALVATDEPIVIPKDATELVRAEEAVAGDCVVSASVR